MSLVDEILTDLANLGTPQNRKIYARHGVTGPCHGVSYANLDKLARRLRKADIPHLAADLWSTGNHDARALAMKVIRPAELSNRLVDRWAREADSPVLAGDLGTALGRSGWREAMATADRWLAADPVKRASVVLCGWCLLAALAGQDALDVPDLWWVGHLDKIEAEIGSEPDRARHAMNNALIAIGARNPELRERAEASARRIGKVEVDHGETGCRTPDAISYLAKVWAHRERKSGRSRR